VTFPNLAQARGLRPAAFQPPRRSQTSRRSSYTVIGSPKRPRPWLRIVKPRLAARRRDGSFSPSAMYAVTISTPPRLQRSPMATRIASVAIPWLRRFSRTHQPASTSLGAIPSMPSPAKRSSAAPRKLLSPTSRIAHGPNPCSRHCSSAARVSRNASAEFPDARACSASSSGESGDRISRAVRRAIACSAESPTKCPSMPPSIAEPSGSFGNSVSRIG
jgi:hypothetical protein